MSRFTDDAFVALEDARQLLEQASNHLTYTHEALLLQRIDDWMVRYQRIIERPGGSYDEQPGSGL